MTTFVWLEVFRTFLGLERLFNGFGSKGKRCRRKMESKVGKSRQKVFLPYFEESTNSGYGHMS